jgi:CTP-dependent riboflavin kinase
MSIRHIAAVADLVGLSATRKAILFSLAIDADAEGVVKVHRKQLSERAGVSERTLRSNLQWLVKNAYLTWWSDVSAQLYLERMP